MIVVSNTGAVVLTPGQAMVFNDVVWKSGCGELFRSPGSIIRVGRGCYEVSFNGNITNADGTAAVQLAIAADGSILPETTMTSTPSAANAVNNVAAGTIVGNQPSCCNQNPGTLSFSVVNTAATDVTIAPNSKFSVKRVG